MSILLVVQARMASTRLPGKSMAEVLGRPLLGYLLERLKRCSLVDQLVVATTNNPLDDVIVDYCTHVKIAVFRGSEENVLDRFWQAAKIFHAGSIVRITADCPLMDPKLVDSVIGEYLKSVPPCDYISSTLVRTYPRGMDVEVFSRKTLDIAAKEASLDSEKEHVTPFIYCRPERFILKGVNQQKDDSGYRLTVDTYEDLELITRILENLYPRIPEFTLKDVMQLLEEHPEWGKINAHIKQKELGS